MAQEIREEVQLTFEGVAVPLLEATLPAVTVFPDKPLQLDAEGTLELRYKVRWVNHGGDGPEKIRRHVLKVQTNSAVLRPD